MILLLNGGLDKPPSRLATLDKRVLIALTLWNTKAGGLQLYRAHFFWYNFDLILPKFYGSHQGMGAGWVFVKWSVVLVPAGSRLPPQSRLGYHF